MNVELKQIHFGGISLQIPEIWSVATESYTEPDGRECAMIDISANDGDPRSVVISYGPILPLWKPGTHMRNSSVRLVLQ